MAESEIHFRGFGWSNNGNDDTLEDMFPVLEQNEESSKAALALLLIKRSCRVVTNYLTFIIFSTAYNKIHSESDELPLEEVNYPTDQGIIH